MQRAGTRYIEAVFVESQQRYLLKQHALSPLNEPFLAPCLT